MSKELPRESKLASRHRELGSDLEDWNGMGTAWSYDSNADDEHNAVREGVGMFDMSPLKKVHIRGADSAVVVDHLITRKMEQIYTGKSAYGAVLNEEGGVCDDAIIANNGDEYLLVHGTGESMEMLQDSAQGKNVDIEFDDDMHDISVQGPKSVLLLNAHMPINLSSLIIFTSKRRKFLVIHVQFLALATQESVDMKFLLAQITFVMFGTTLSAKVWCHVHSIHWIKFVLKRHCCSLVTI